MKLIIRYKENIALFIFILLSGISIYHHELWRDEFHSWLIVNESNSLAELLDNRINEVPAVVHLDGTGRLQTVTENDNLWFYNLLKLFMKKTNVPIILNTSFNDREPIVETPQDALGCFLRTDIDFLYFRDGNILVSKKNEDE